MSLSLCIGPKTHHTTHAQVYTSKGVQVQVYMHISAHTHTHIPSLLALALGDMTKAKRLHWKQGAQPPSPGIPKLPPPKLAKVYSNSPQLQLRY